MFVVTPLLLRGKRRRVGRGTEKRNKRLLGNGVLETGFRGLAFELRVPDFRGEGEDGEKRRWEMGALEAPMFVWWQN